MPLTFGLNDQEKKFLCDQAAYAIDSGFADGSVGAAPKRPDKSPNSPLFRNLGSFVTLTLKGRLRGCIGTIIAHEPLWLNVWNMARAAAFQDPRFPSLTAAEWSNCSFEISVLDQPELCPDPNQIKIGRDGLILQYRGRTGVFLPQVPVEQHWNLEEYLENLCGKAGVPQGSWESPEAKLFWYQALVFGCSEN